MVDKTWLNKIVNTMNAPTGSSVGLSQGPLHASVGYNKNYGFGGTIGIGDKNIGFSTKITKPRKVWVGRE